MAVTAPITADAVLKVAASQVGIHEDPPGSNLQKFGQWYGMNGQPWCAMYVSWVLHQAGWSDFAIDTPKGFSYCPSGVSWFQQQGAWAGPEVTPQPGWVVFYRFSGPVADHTGLVQKPDNGINTFEGNTNDAMGATGGEVRNHHRTVAQGVLGYGVITYQPAIPLEEDDDMPKLYVLTDSLNYGGVQYNKGDVWTVWPGFRHLLSPGVEFDGHKAQWGEPVGINSIAWAWIVDNTALDEIGERSIPPAQYQQLIADIAKAVGTSKP